MATTTNFGWETPDDTDLVKDGAAAMRTLGNSIDSSFVDLKGGTTGQILSKNSNTDLDYVWINNDQGDITAVTAGTGISGGGTSGAVTITNSMATTIDAKGDLIIGTAADSFDRLAVGANDTLLIADSTQSTGLRWGGTWTAYTPTLKQGATTIAITGNNSRYIQIGKTVIVWNLFSANATGSAGANIQISLPVNVKQTGATGGSGWVYRAASFIDYPALSYFDTSNTFLMKPTNTTGAGLWLGSSQFTAAVAAGDIFYFINTYEAA